MKLAATFRLKICEVYDAVNKYAAELLGIVPKLFFSVVQNTFFFLTMWIFLWE